MRQVLEIQGIEQNARYREMEIDDRLMQLERQDRTAPGFEEAPTSERMEL